MSADLVASVGDGLTLPFLVVYLTVACEFSMVVTAVVMTVMVVAGLVGGPLGGWCADRYGPRVAMRAGWAVAAAGTLMMTQVDAAWHAAASAAIIGIGGSAAWPATDSLLATTVRESRRSDVFAVRHTGHNIGLGAGSLLATVLVDPAQSASYLVLFHLNGALLLVAAIMPVLGTRSPRPVSPTAPIDLPVRATGGGYRQVMRDRLLLRLLALSALLIVGGFAQFNVTLPAYLSATPGMDVRIFGVWLTLNTITVVVLQLLALRALRGWRRSRLIVVLSVVWAASWGLILLAGYLDQGAGTALVLLTAITFGAGEVLFPMTIPALVNGIAPADLVGRYNGASAFTFTLSTGTAFLAAGLLLDHAWYRLLFLSCVALCVMSAALAYATSRRIPAEVDIASRERDHSSDRRA